MAEIRSKTQQAELNSLLQRDHTLNGGILVGLDGYVIEIQARAVEVLKKQATWDSPTITGMHPDAAREVQQRIKGAFAKLCIPGPEVKILINLAPADLFKAGSWLDLPLAIIMLQAAGLLPDLPEHLEGEYILIGELGIHGEVRRVPGALSLAYVAKPNQKLIVPAGNEKECSLILAKPGHEGCGVYPVQLLEEVIQFFQGKRTLENSLSQSIQFDNHIPTATDFGLVRGQARAKRAAIISAAGGHNLLMIGPPGEGKSMLAGAIAGILPKLNNAEKVELTKIYSACGELKHDGVAVTRRPMRTIHHTATKTAVIGGGHGIPKPGEVTLAHNGVLFLDEIAEFSRDTLESLRQPIEDGVVRISRVQAKVTYPCQFTLIAAMNPCPCGYFGTDSCRCKETEVLKYLSKISGPILDRIDLHVELQPLSTKERMAPAKPGESAMLRKQVQEARECQHKRFSESGINCNAVIPGGQIFDFCQFTASASDHFASIIDEKKVSTRSMTRLAKVSRTIADLAKADKVENSHIDEAAGFVVGGMLKDMF